MRVEFLPPNCTSKIKPLNLGIIRSFKMNYRNQLVKKCLLNVESGGRQKSVNVLEALHLISSAWEKVSVHCISSSFVKAGFPEIRNNETEFEEIESINSNQIENCISTSGINFEDYITCDNNIVTSEVPTPSDLIDSDSDSCESAEGEEECEMPTSIEATQAIKIVKAFLSNSEGQETNLQKVICVENAISDIIDKNRQQTKITDFFV